MAAHTNVCVIGLGSMAGGGALQAADEGRDINQRRALLAAGAKGPARCRRGTDICWS